MNTKLEVSRGPSGLRVHLPSGRTLDISAGAAGAKFLYQLLSDADNNSPRSGYIGAFPTQEITDIWLRQERVEIDRQASAIIDRKREIALDELTAKTGVDPRKLQWTI